MIQFNRVVDGRTELTASLFNDVYECVDGVFYNVTSYDSPQDAVDAASTAGGGTVFFPSGLYTLTETLVVPLNPTVVIRGSGVRAALEQQGSAPWATTFATGTAGMELVSVGTGSALYHAGPTFEGITFENRAGGNATMVHVDTVNRCTFRDCVFRGYEAVSSGTATDHGLVMGFVIEGGDCAFHMIDNCSFFGLGGDSLNWYGQGTILGGEFSCVEGGYAMRLRGGNTRILGPKVDNGLMEFNVQASTIIVHSEYHHNDHPAIVTIGTALSDRHGWSCRANTFRGSVRASGGLAFALGEHAHQNEITAFVEYVDSPAYSEHESATNNTVTLYDEVEGYPVT